MKSVTPSVQFHNLHSHHTVVEMCAIRLSVRIKTAAPQTIVFGLSRFEGGERDTELHNTTNICAYCGCFLLSLWPLGSASTH